MRVLLINYEYPPVGGGAGNATAFMARSLAELGHSPVVLTAAYGSEPARSTSNGVTVVRVAALRARPDRSSMFEMATYVAAAALALPRLLRLESPDAAIVFFSMPCGPLGLLAQWWSGLPYVVSLRGGDVPGTESSLGIVYSLLSPFRRLVLRKSVAVIANSEGLKALSERVDPISVQVIPNGVDTCYFRPGASNSARPFTFLFVGRFQSQKNLDFLLEAVSRLRQVVAVQFRMVFVGDGPLRNELQRRSIALGIADVVTWHGWCSKEQLLAHYQSSDCFLNPSLYEGMPNAVLEAMACGLPVLASNVPGNNAVVTHGETGLLFRLDDLALLVADMQRVLIDQSLSSRMGNNGRTKVAADYSWNSVALSYVSLLPGVKVAK